MPQQPNLKLNPSYCISNLDQKYTIKTFEVKFYIFCFKLTSDGFILKTIQYKHLINIYQQVKCTYRKKPTSQKKQYLILQYQKYKKCYNKYKIIQKMIQDKPKSKYQLTLITKLAQQTQRYQQMAQYAKRLLLINDQILSNAERNLCASAYKNLVNNRRAELKVLNAIGKKIGNKETKQMSSAIKNYRAKIQNQLINTCLEVIKIIQSGKIQIKSIEHRIFFLKMRGDFYRYLCEVDDNEGKYFTSASLCYQEADTLARSNLPPTNQVRLSLHLNMSVFLYERCGQIEKALDLANRAFDQAVANVNQTNQQSFKNCTMILQLIRDNINLWSQQADV